MAKLLSGAAVLLLLVVPLCMYTCALLIGVQLGRAIERRPNSVSISFSIRGPLGYVAKELWDTSVFGGGRNERSSEQLMDYTRLISIPLEGSATIPAYRCNRYHAPGQGEYIISLPYQPRNQRSQRPPDDVFGCGRDAIQAPIPLGSSVAPNEAQRYNRNHTSPMRGVISVGPWGGSGGQPFYMHGGSAPRLRSIILYHSSGAIHSLACEYSLAGDGAYRMAGPWGRPHSGSFGSMGLLRTTINLSARERVTAVEGTIGHFPHVRGVVITSLTFRTSIGRMYGPYGANKAGTGTPFSVPAANGACIAGFWGRSGWLLDAIGVYVRPCYLLKPGLHDHACVASGMK